MTISFGRPPSSQSPKEHGRWFDASRRLIRRAKSRITMSLQCGHPGLNLDQFDCVALRVQHGRNSLPFIRRQLAAADRAGDTRERSDQIARRAQRTYGEPYWPA